MRARAPTRIDFAGGTTDLAAFAAREGGAVISAAIARYAYATALAGGQGIALRGQDLDEYVRADTVRELEMDGQLDLLKAAVREMGVEGGFEVRVRCDAPRGSGIGSSASLGVAVVGALEAMRAARSEGPRERRSRIDIAELACRLEKHLGVVGGKQDQYAAALGGFNYMEFVGEVVRVEPVAMPAEMVCELEKHLVLCYSGQARLSGAANQRMIAAYEAGDEAVGAALRRIREIAREIYRALLAEDLRDLPALLNEEWECRTRLAGGLVTPGMAAQREAAMAAGALAAKICGAGGGGCVLFYVAPDREAQVRRALVAAGGEPLDFVFDFTGLQRWACTTHDDA
jgi:D-glycero-alpha-D-manno-heptose-7-phosphate kinase